MTGRIKAETIHLHGGPLDGVEWLAPADGEIVIIRTHTENIHGHGPCMYRRVGGIGEYVKHDHNPRGEDDDTDLYTRDAAGLPYGE
jgi:hypothetical protein